MKLIKLTQGQFAMVDDEDFEYLNQWKWYADKIHNKFYARRRPSINGKKITFSMHSVVMNTPKGFDTDHVDQNGLNNQKQNLRICSHRDNMRNQTSKKGATSKYVGVCWVPKARKWTAQITDNNKKRINLGYFVNEKDAALAYNEAVKVHYGEFANLNVLL